MGEGGRNLFKALGDKMKSFRQQVFKGIFWMGGSRVINKLLGLLKTIILARILFPSDFGKFGITLLSLSLLETFSETGFRQALIQKPKDIKNDLPSAWLVFFIRGLAISILLVISAPFISYFFQEDVRQLIYLLALTPLIRGLTNPAVVLFRKELKFQKEFIFRTAAVLVEVAVGIVSGLLLRSVLALVLSQLAGALSELILSLIMLPIPRGRASLKRIRQLFSFGRWITGSSILSYLTNQGDDLVVGKVLNAQALGLYQTAFRFGLLPATQVAGMFSQISLPILSRVSPKKRFAKTVTLAWTTAYPAFLLGGILVLFAKELVSLLLGERWLPMVGALRIVAVFGMVRSLGSVLTTYFVSQGRPEINTMLNLLKLTVIALGIFPSVKFWGIEGAVLVVLLAVLATNSMAFLLLIRESSEKKMLRELLKPLSVLLVTAGLVLAIKPFLGVYSLAVYLSSFLVTALLIDKHLRDLFEQELLPRLPECLKDFYIQQKIFITKRGWFDRNWKG